MENPIGNVIREARRGREERLVDVAEAIGISPAMLSRIENGDRLPSSEVAHRLAAHLGLAPDALAMGAQAERDRRSTQRYSSPPRAYSEPMKDPFSAPSPRHQESVWRDINMDASMHARYGPTPAQHASAHSFIESDQDVDAEEIADLARMIQRRVVRMAADPANAGLATDAIADAAEFLVRALEETLATAPDSASRARAASALRRIRDTRSR